MILHEKLLAKGFSFKCEIKGGGQSFTCLLEQDGVSFLLKTPLVTVLSGEQRFRFKQEAQALQLLAGNGTPKVFDFDFESEKPFILMEYIKGETLGKFVNGKPIPVDEAIIILEKLVKIISQIHEIGMQHRDIKPDNIIVRENGEIVLIDFGLCRIETDKIEFKTPNGKELGNRFLRLPELGKGEKIASSVSDVTFLTGIFFYLLTGKQPNQLLDENNLTPHRRLNSNKIFQDLNWLNQTFDKGFAYSIAQRFQTAIELLSFIKLHKDMVPDFTDNNLVNEFDALLNSHAYSTLDKILNDMILVHYEYNRGLEEAVGVNVKTLGVPPQIDNSGYSVKTDMFILPASRQNPRIWWQNISTISSDLTTISHVILVDNKVFEKRDYSTVEQDRMKQEYYELGCSTGLRLLKELLQQMKL